MTLFIGITHERNYIYFSVLIFLFLILQYLISIINSTHHEVAEFSELFGMAVQGISLDRGDQDFDHYMRANAKHIKCQAIYIRMI